jgi:hypothetical protein
MEINVTVLLGDGDNLAYTADAAASQVLAALGGNPTTDVCYVSVSQASHGTAGTPGLAEVAP